MWLARTPLRPLRTDRPAARFRPQKGITAPLARSIQTALAVCSPAFALSSHWNDTGAPPEHRSNLRAARSADGPVPGALRPADRPPPGRSGGGAGPRRSASPLATGGRIGGGRAPPHAPAGRRHMQESSRGQTVNETRGATHPARDPPGGHAPPPASAAHRPRNPRTTRVLRGSVHGGARASPAPNPYRCHGDRRARGGRGAGPRPARKPGLPMRIGHSSSPGVHRTSDNRSTRPEGPP